MESAAVRDGECVCCSVKCVRWCRKEKSRASRERFVILRFRRLKEESLDALESVAYFVREVVVIPGREERVRDLRGRRLSKSSVEKDDSGKLEMWRFEREGR